MLPDDEEEEVPLRERRMGKGSSGKAPYVQVPQSTLVLETVVEQSGDPVQTNVIFANPLSNDLPSGSTAQTPAAPVQLHASDPEGA